MGVGGACRGSGHWRGTARVAGAVEFLLASASEFTHVDREVVFLEDFAAEEIFHDVFHGDDAGGGAELVNDDEELLVGFEAELEGVGGGGGLGDEVDFLHVFTDGLEVEVVSLGLEEVAAAHETDDLIEVFGINGYAGKGDVRVVAKDFVNGSVAFEGGDDGAWGHDLADAHGIEGEGVGDDVGLAFAEGAALGAALGKENNLLVGVVVFDGRLDDEAHDFIGDVGDGAQGVAHPD